MRGRVWLGLGIATVQGVQASERVLDTGLNISICTMFLYLLLRLLRHLAHLLQLQCLLKQLGVPVHSGPKVSFDVPEGKCRGQQVVVQSWLGKMIVPIPTGARAGRKIIMPIPIAENRV